VYAASKDFQPYEGSPGYVGENSPEQYYQAFRSNHKTPAQLTMLGAQPAVTFTTADNGGMGDTFGIQTDTQINRDPFYGLTVFLDMYPYAQGDLSDQQDQDFINKIESHTLDPVEQARIDQYNIFLSSFVFTK
jgi:hypothetical protein